MREDLVTWLGPLDNYYSNFHFELNYYMKTSCCMSQSVIFSNQGLANVCAMDQLFYFPAIYIYI